MSIAQYKDRSRNELWALAQIQAIEYESALKRIAELEVGIRRLIDVSTLKSQEKAMVELDELIKEQGE